MSSNKPFILISITYMTSCKIKVIGVCLGPTTLTAGKVCGFFVDLPIVYSVKFSIGMSQRLMEIHSVFIQPSKYKEGSSYKKSCVLL